MILPLFHRLFVFWVVKSGQLLPGGSRGVMLAHDLRDISLGSRMNPYQSPLERNERSGSREQNALRGSWLPSASLILAFLIEVLPTEADIVFIALLKQQLHIALIAKAICLAIILAPLIAYLALNHWAGLRAARARIIGVFVIVGIKAAMDISSLIHHSQVAL